MALRHGRCLSLTENRDLDKSRRHQDKFGSSGVQEFGRQKSEVRKRLPHAAARAPKSTTRRRGRPRNNVKRASSPVEGQKGTVDGYRSHDPALEGAGPSAPRIQWGQCSAPAAARGCSPPKSTTGIRLVSVHCKPNFLQSRLPGGSIARKCRPAPAGRHFRADQDEFVRVGPGGFLAKTAVRPLHAGC